MSAGPQYLHSAVWPPLSALYWLAPTVCFYTLLTGATVEDVAFPVQAVDTFVRGPQYTEPMHMITSHVRTLSLQQIKQFAVFIVHISSCDCYHERPHPDTRCTMASLHGQSPPSCLSRYDHGITPLANSVMTTANSSSLYRYDHGPVDI